MGEKNDMILFDFFMREKRMSFFVCFYVICMLIGFFQICIYELLEDVYCTLCHCSFEFSANNCFLQKEI